MITTILVFAWCTLACMVFTGSSLISQKPSKRRYLNLPVVGLFSGAVGIGGAFYFAVSYEILNSPGWSTGFSLCLFGAGLVSWKIYSNGQPRLLNSVKNNLLDLKDEGIIITDLALEVVHANRYFFENILNKNTDLDSIHLSALEQLGLKLDMQGIYSNCSNIEIKSNQLLFHQTTKTFYDDNGTAAGKVIFLKNITDFRKVEHELVHAQKEAESASRAKSDFLATMSHEIRTPMNGIIGMTQLMAETALDSVQRDYNDTITTSSENLLAIINDILDFSKIESGKMEIYRDQCNLRQEVENVLDLFAAKAAEKDLDLVYLIDNNVPSVVMADGTRVRQILVNLVGNALKFTEKGEIFVRVRVSPGQELRIKEGKDFQLEVSVKDTGIGIKADKIDSLFTAFTQEDSSTTRKYGGTGLGLAISKRLTELMDGKISVESKKDLGSVFHFTVTVGSAKAFPQKYVGNETVVFKGEKVLVVDDNLTNREILRIQLEKWNLTPILAASGSQALQFMNKETDFELVLTDMHMPGVDGIKLTEHIRERYSLEELPIIMLSSVADMGVISAKRHLLSNFLTKPVKQEELFSVITNTFLKAIKRRVDEKRKERIDHNLADKYPLRILVAEDNVINQKLIGRLLGSMGYDPEIVENGSKVIQSLHKKKYDLIFMDVQMPEMDGMEATRLIKSTFEEDQIPVIVAMTANAMQGDKENCMEAGMDDYISKPYQVERIQEILTTYVQTAVAKK